MIRSAIPCPNSTGLRPFFTTFVIMRLSRLADRLQSMPMLRLLVPFVAGILLADHYELPTWLLAAAFLGTGCTALLLHSQSALAGLLFTTGFAAVQLRTHPCTTPREVPTTFVLRIEGIPVERPGYRTAEAIVESWRDPQTSAWHPSGDRLRIHADTLAPLFAGERICCRGRIRPLRGGSAGYRTRMARRGVIGTLYVGRNSLLERLGTAGSLHLGAARRLRRLGAEKDAGAVVQAMVVADRSGIRPELRERYARSGFSHLLALSGLHTGILFALVNLLLWWLPLLRRGHLLRSLLSTTAVWLFVAAAGFPPSAVRAAAMCTLLQGALAAGSEYVGLNALAAAAFGMLLWRPDWFYDVGFRLSFLSVGAILAWGIPLCRRIRTGYRILDRILEALAISFAASLATAPLVAHTFGIVPLAGILLNPPAILLATIVVFGGTLWLIFAPELLAPLLRWTVTAACDALDALARLAAAIPHGTLDTAPGAATTGAVYLLFLVATLAAWAADPPAKRRRGLGL